MARREWIVTLNEWYTRRAKSAVTRTNLHEYAGISEQTQLNFIGFVMAAADNC
jgi:hypothetical protein